MLFLPIGKIKKNKDSIVWFFLNISQYLVSELGTRCFWFMVMKGQMCSRRASTNVTLVGEETTGNESHFYKRRERETKIWFVSHFFFPGCFRISIFRWISHLCEFMKGKLRLPVFFSQATHSVFHSTFSKWFHSVRNVTCNSVYTRSEVQEMVWDLGFGRQLSFMLPPACTHSKRMIRK